jgi:NADPH2:quinone reductase
MKAIEVRKFGGPEMLTLVDKEIPVPGEKEVLVRVFAIGVNPVETYIRAGMYPRLPNLPYVPGGNVAGMIDQCGPGVSSWKVGDRIYSSETLSGGYAAFSLCHEEQIFSLPDNVDFRQGAAIGVPAATAWRGLFIRGEGKRGERVLVHGGSGTVGQAAIQLGRDQGLEMFGTAGSATGCEAVRALGAVGAANHNDPGYVDVLFQMTGGKGFDLILEMLANKNLEADLNLLAPGGRVVIIGSRGRIEIDPRLTMGKETDIRGLAVFNASREETVQTHRGLVDCLARGVLKPTISRELPLAEAPLAHQLVMENLKCGKIVLIP